MAWASPCFLYVQPLIGIVNYNLANLNTSDLFFEETVDTSIHEIMHILALNNEYYHYYINENQKILNYSDVFK